MSSLHRRGLPRLLIVLLVLSLVLPLTLVRCPDTGLRGPQPIVLWHAFREGGREDVALREALAEIAAHGQALPLQVHALGGQLGGVLSQAIATGQLPDLLLAPSEWAPLLHQAGLLHLLPLDPNDSWLPAIAATLIDHGSMLGLPVFAATLGLGRTDALVGQPWPSSVMDLTEQALWAKAGGAGELFWDLNDAYYSLPWFVAAGGELEPATDWSGIPQPNEVASHAWLDTVEAIAASATGELPADLVTAWYEGQVALAPLLPPEYLALRAAGISLDLGPLPGGRALMSSWVLMLPRNAINPREDVVELVVRMRINDDEGLLYLSLLTGYLPPTLELFADQLLVLAGLDAYRDVAIEAVPMPSGRYAAETWSVYETALVELLDGAKANDVIARLKDRITELEQSAP